ncbi:MAG: ATP-binding protein, partial [Calditrichales bacterium]|nr:ATP-binding protein [Calditrichales bacterium]
NLISNAIKYSRDEKYISISASIEDNFAVIHVEDKGMGISLEEQDRIFDTFYRAEDEKIQSLAGAGLGLTIIRHIVEAHDGKIEVKSSPGKGSKFSLYLPLEAGNEKHLNH